ncbi:MAG: hypothetical protein M1381_11925 [Deltaproteobacteria bacterium]|nr:hypothetical protein [Deltaproteobacteria bacterium]
MKKAYTFVCIKSLALLFIFGLIIPADKYTSAGMSAPPAPLFFITSVSGNTKKGRPPVPPAYLTITPGYKKVILVWGMPINVKIYKEEYFRDINKKIKHTAKKTKTASHSLLKEHYYTHYNIYITKTPGGTYSKVGFTTTTSYSITGLTNGTVYCFEVTEENSAGESARSKQACSTPQDIYMTEKAPLGIAFHRIAIDKLGNVWMTDHANNSVFKLGPDGTMKGMYTVGKNPQALAIDSIGNVWVANHDDGTVTKLNPAGITVGSYHAGELLKDIAIDAHNNAWIVSANHIVKLSPDGRLLGRYIVGISPGNIAIDSSGHLWVSLYQEKAVVEVKPTGIITALYKVKVTPLIMAIGPSDTIWVGSTRSRKIVQLKQSQIITRQGSFPALSYYDTYRGYYPAGMAIDALGNVWISNRGSRQVVELDKSGNLIGAYNMPLGLETGRIAIDPSGNVFITHPNDNNFTEIVGVAKGPQYHPYKISPVKISFKVSPNPVPTGSSAEVFAGIASYEGALFTYTWTTSTEGWVVTGNGQTATITAPCQYPSTGAISVTVSDNYGDTASSSLSVSTSLVTHIYQVGNVPNGIALDASGNIWVVNSHDNTVSKLDSSGSIIGTYPVGGATPADIAIDRSGNLWITNIYSATVTKMSPSGSIIATYPAGTYPAGIAIDSSGNMWIANSWSNYITRLNSSGSILGTFYSGKYPAGMAVDASGNLWIANYQGNSVTELSPSGSIIATVAISDSPSGIAIDSYGNIWVPNNTSVIKLSPSGSIQGTFPIGAGLHNVAIDSSNNLWIINVNDNSLTELSPDGEIMNKYQVGTQPYAPIIDAKGNVWTVNYGGNNITELVCVAKGPQYFPFSGPQFPGGQNY